MTPNSQGESGLNGDMGRSDYIGRRTTTQVPKDGQKEVQVVGFFRETVGYDMAEVFVRCVQDGELVGPAFKKQLALDELTEPTPAG